MLSAPLRPARSSELGKNWSGRERYNRRCSFSYRNPDASSLPLGTEEPEEEIPQPLSPSSLPAGASHWLNPHRSWRTRGDPVSWAQSRKEEGTQRTPGKQHSPRWWWFPYFPHLVQVEIGPSQTLMKIHELYCPLGGYGVTKPQTQLHRLLSPSQSSFPKGNNTCPKSPPATATSLNPQLPGADSKSQKRVDFSRERWAKWMQNSSVHTMKNLMQEGEWGKLERGQGRPG